MISGAAVAESEDPTGGRSIRFGWWLAGIALAGLALRVGYVYVVAPHAPQGLDAIWYHLQAGSIADGTGYVDPRTLFTEGRGVATANFPPLWPALLALPVKAGVTSVRTLQLTGAVVGTGTVVLTGLIGRRLLTPRVGLVAAAIAAGLPALLAADGSLMADSLYVVLVLAGVLAGLRGASDSASLSWWALSGVLLGLAALARSDALLLIPFVLGAFIIRGEREAVKRRLRGLATAAACVVLSLVPWVVRNHAEMGTWNPLSSNSGSLLEGANCASTYGRVHLGAWDAACLIESDQVDRPELERADRARRAGIDYATSHLARTPVVAAARVLRAWGLYDPIDQAREFEAVESRTPDWQVLAWATSLALLGSGVVGLVLTRRRGLRTQVLTNLVIGATFVALVSWGNSRFVLVALPALAIYAAAALDELWSRRRSRRAGPAEASAG